MYKIFKVHPSTNTEKEITKLIEEGKFYIPEFENNIGIENFCLDLEIVADGVLEPNIFMIISGFKKDTVINNPDLIEVTERQFKELVQTGYSIKDIGTNRLLSHLGFSIEPYTENLTRCWSNVS
jgi:hypothetical protein